MRKVFRDSLHYLFGNPSISYTHLVVAMQKSENELSEAQEVRSKAAEVQAGKGNTVLAAITEQVPYLTASLDIKSSSSGNQRNREGQQKRVNGPGNQELGNNNTNRADPDQSISSNGTQNSTPGNQRGGVQVQCF